MMASSIAELERPSRVACSDLLDHVFSIVSVSSDQNKANHGTKPWAKWQKPWLQALWVSDQRIEKKTKTTERKNPGGNKQQRSP